MREYFSEIENIIAIIVALLMVFVLYQNSTVVGMISFLLFLVFVYIEIKHHERKTKIYEVVIVYDLISDLRYFADSCSVNKVKFNDYELSFIKEKLELMNIRLGLEEKEISLGAKFERYKEWIEENSYQKHTKDNEKISKIRKYQFDMVVSYLEQGNYRKALWELVEFVLKEKEKGLNKLEGIALIELNKLYLYCLENKNIKFKNTSKNLDTTVLKSQLKRKKRGK